MKQFLKKLEKLILIATFAAIVSLFLQMTVFALESGPLLPLDTDGKVRTLFQDANLPVPPVDDEATGKIGDTTHVLNILFEKLYSYVKVILVSVSILYITIIGFNLLTALGDEEQVRKAKKAITYTLIGLAVLSMALEFAKLFNLGGGNSLFASPGAILQRIYGFDKLVTIFLTFIKYIVASYATLMVVISAFRLITAGGDDELTSKHKKSILYSAGGLVVIYVGDVFIKKVFYVTDPSKYTGIAGAQPAVNAAEGVKEIVGITNFVISFVAPISLLLLIIASIMYLTAQGEDDQMEKAKRIFTTTIIGIVIVYASFAIVKTVIDGSLSENITSLT
jgi:hypothetical protein